MFCQLNHNKTIHNPICFAGLESQWLCFFPSDHQWLIWHLQLSYERRIIIFPAITERYTPSSNAHDEKPNRSGWLTYPYEGTHENPLNHQLMATLTSEWTPTTEPWLLQLLIRTVRWQKVLLSAGACKPHDVLYNGDMLGILWGY